MEQLDIPTVIFKSLQTHSNAAKYTSRDMVNTLNVLAALGTRKNVVLDQFRNTVFLTATVAQDKNGYKVAEMWVYQLDKGADMVDNLYSFLEKMKKRKVSVLKFVTDNTKLVPFFATIGKKYPIEVRRDAKTNTFYGTINVQEPE
jgi:hypothetical protein